MSHVCDRCSDERSGCCVDLDRIVQPVGDLSILDRVADAVRSAYDKHGRITADPVRASLILTSECSEAADEALKMTNPSGTSSHRNAAGTPEAMVKELLQVAATALAIIYVLEHNVKQS